MSSERCGELLDRHLLPIDSVNNAFFPMRQDTANKTVSVLVVFAPEQVHNLTDFFGSEVFIFCDCKMQLAEDSSQSLWKANRGENWSSLFQNSTLPLQIAFLERNNLLIPLDYYAGSYIPGSDCVFYA